MENILAKISEVTKQRVTEDMKKMSYKEVRDRCDELVISKERPFLRALEKEGLSFICEIKKASPSKGIISDNFPYLDIAKKYEKAGADCISCLTEPEYFLGSDKIFADVRRTVTIPMLRKDFVVDEYQLYQAKLMGADAVLLIVAITEEERLKHYLDICDSLELDALVETHDRQEIETALSSGAKIIGVNNRNLKDFSVNISNAVSLRESVPPDCIFVSESGVSTSGDIKNIKKMGADAVLMGEVLMRSNDIEKTLKDFKNTI